MNAHQETTASGRIVVGVDGSESAKAALTWAVGQAELTGATVEAVIAWHFPYVGGVPYGPIAVMEQTDFSDIANRILTDAIRETISADDNPAGTSVKIGTMIREGNAAQVLLDAAKDADLLVVGSRGHGGFAGALLGSVSQHCVHHAQCPVVIVRGATES
jgi:nucleotide-binding universal stress UspA family protein